jgi:hypothetical protein
MPLRSIVDARHRVTFLGQSFPKKIGHTHFIFYNEQFHSTADVPEIRCIVITISLGPERPRPKKTI